MACAVAGTAVVTAQDTPELEPTLARAAERVAEFFTRAQSLVVTEQVYVQPLSYGLAGDGPGRSIESELRLTWSPGADGDGATEAQTLRLVHKVNGRKPRANDRNNCTTPEQHDTETQVLSMLLPSQRDDYVWTLAGRGKVDGRAAILLDFQEKQTMRSPTSTSSRATTTASATTSKAACAAASGSTPNPTTCCAWIIAWAARWK